MPISAAESSSITSPRRQDEWERRRRETMARERRRLAHAICRPRHALTRQGTGLFQLGHFARRHLDLRLHVGVGPTPAERGSLVASVVGSANRRQRRLGGVATRVRLRGPRWSGRTLTHDEHAPSHVHSGFPQRPPARIHDRLRSSRTSCLAGVDPPTFSRFRCWRLEGHHLNSRSAHLSRISAPCRVRVILLNGQRSPHAVPSDARPLATAPARSSTQRALDSAQLTCRESSEGRRPCGQRSHSKQRRYPRTLGSAPWQPERHAP